MSVLPHSFVTRLPHVHHCGKRHQEPSDQWRDHGHPQRSAQPQPRRRRWLVSSFVSPHVDSFICGDFSVFAMLLWRRRKIITCSCRNAVLLQLLWLFYDLINRASSLSSSLTKYRNLEYVMTLVICLASLKTFILNGAEGVASHCSRWVDYATSVHLNNS